MDDTNALATRADRTPAVITTPDEYSAALKRWEGHFHVLSPFTDISGLAPQHGIIVSTVRINPDPAKGGPGEVYDGLPFLKGDEVALAKLGLRKIADCGAISTSTIRTDPRTIPHYWEFKAIASYRGIDGAIVVREATVEWDLRTGSDRLKGWRPDQITEGRKNGLRNCEARAINAAIRECGLKQKYTQRELAKPFIVLRVAFQPDMTDPDQKRIVTENALRGTSALYAPHALPAGGSSLDGDVVDAESRQERHVGSGSAEPTKPAVDAPPTEDAVRIVDVKSHDGQNAKGKPWTRWIVIDSNGVEASTFDRKLADFAIECKKTGAWVELGVATENGYTNVMEITPAGAQPSLPDMKL